MFFKWLFKKKDSISKSFIDNRYTVENINAVGREVTILIDDIYQYKCRRIGKYIAVQKSGRYFENAGIHDIFILYEDESYSFKGIFDDYNDLTYNIQYHSYEIDLHIKDMAYFNEML